MRNLIILSKFSLLAALSLPLGASADNLLTNGDFSAGNVSVQSDYSFIASGQSTTVGTYGIRTSSTDFNPGYNSFGDHTTGTGYMMLLDGASSASTIGWRQTVTVQPNHTYYFSAWLTSSDSSNPATIRFSINGAQIGSDLPLSATAGQWQNFYASWNSGSSASAMITIADETTVSLGNDFALDDLSFSTNALAAVTASIYPAIEIDWLSQTNASYQVQYAVTPNTNVWFDLGNPVAGTGTTNIAFDSSRNQSSRFYRILTLP
jgi:hypothetical protein